MDKKEYLEGLRANVAQVKAARDSLAATKIPLHHAIETLQNSNESDLARLTALQAIGGSITENNESDEALLSLLEDGSAPEVLIEGAVDYLRNLNFSPKRYKEIRPRFHAALKSLARAKDASYQGVAIEILAVNKDPDVQDLLMEGLKDPDKAVIPVPHAIQMLGHDRPTGFHDLLKEIIASSKDPRSRLEAVSHLNPSAEAETKELTMKLWKDEGEDVEIRNAAASCFMKVFPEEFQNHALPMVVDEAEHQDHRVRLLNSLSLRSGAAAEDIAPQGLNALERKLKIDPRIKDTIKTLEKQDLNDDLKSVLSRFQERE